MAHSRLMILPIALQMTRMELVHARYRVPTSTASTSRALGSTACGSPYVSAVDAQKLTPFASFAPHDTAYLIKLMGGNVGSNLRGAISFPDRHYRMLSSSDLTTSSKQAITLLEMSPPSRYVPFKISFFTCDKSRCQTPIGYHYANRPTKSVKRVREVVFQNFGIG
jgi:hypothetical protein